MARTQLTIYDVARRAGVSFMTVSRALRGDKYVSDTARRKVLAACRALRYRRNLNAAMLRGRRSHAVAAIVHTVSHGFYARLLDGIQNAAHRVGYHLLVLRHASETTARLTWRDFEYLLSRRIDGLLIDANLPITFSRRLRAEGLPLVFIDQPGPGPEYSWIGTADFEGGWEITRYVVRHGHRRIAFLAGPVNVYTSNERLRGYRAALTEAGLETKPDRIVHTQYTSTGGYDGMRQAWPGWRKDRVTAVVCANDYIAIGARLALGEAGVAVPGELSITGFAGDEAGAYMWPPLTTMYQPIEAIGAKAFEILASQIEGGNRAVQHERLTPTLLERASVSNLRGRALLPEKTK